LKHRLWLLVGLVVGACGAENSLGGSVGELIELDLSRSDVYRNDEAVQISYYRTRDAFYDVVIRLSVSLKGVTLKPGSSIKLDGDSEDGHPRTSVATAPGGEPVRNFPRVKHGDLYLASGGVPGTVTTGNFSVLFESTGGDLGNDRTLFGNFKAQTVDAGFGPLP
jgi:hypothetical protein